MKVLILAAILGFNVLLNVSAKEKSSLEAKLEVESNNSKKRSREERLKESMDEGVKVTSENVKNFCKDHPNLASCQATTEDSKKKQDHKYIITECNGFHNLTATNSTASFQRVRRSNGYGDPCTNGQYFQTILIHGIGVDNIWYELVHDPASGLFQTFHVKQCNPQPAYMLAGYTCTEIEMMLDALVWIPLGGNAWDIVERTIILPSGCHLWKQL